MNQDNTAHPPMNGDDELAKTLGGGLQFEETPVNGGPVALPSSPAAVTDTNQDDALAAIGAAPAASAEPAPTISAARPADDPDLPSVHHDYDKQPKDKNASNGMAANSANASVPAKPDAPLGDGGPLGKLKASALDELRPLVGKLNLPAEEKFDTLLLIIRSTDDQGLLGEAHDAAQQISDDARRAQALLDIIKEIDYFANKK